MRKEPRLQFTDEERANPRLRKAIRKADRAAERAETARSAIPTRTIKRKQRTVDPATGKVTVRLHFEETKQKKPTSGLTKALRDAPVNSAVGAVHREIRSDEQDNVGVESAHKTEEAGETAGYLIQEGRRAHKLRPYRRAERSEARLAQANVNALYQRAMEENPELFSNPISRWQQKRTIRQQYAAARQAAQTGTQAARTVGAVGERLQAWGAVLRRHSRGMRIAIALLLVTSMLLNLMSSCSLILQGGVSSLTVTTYPSEDEDMLGAEAAYARMESELLNELTRYESDHPGYDEYIYNMDAIGHDPYTLISLLTAYYQSAWTLGEVTGLLSTLFEMQYELETHVETVEDTITVRAGESLGTVRTTGYCPCSICCGRWAGGPTASGRYPQASHTVAVDAYNPILPLGSQVIINGTLYTVEDTGNLAANSTDFDIFFSTHQEALNWGRRSCEVVLAGGEGEEIELTVTRTVCTVSLRNTDLSLVARELLTEEQYSWYSIYMATLGNRPDLFPQEAYPYVPTRGDYQDYEIPPEALSDERFAAMIAEAEQYLGYPYVWGGSSPSTSFDCSGFVSWVINHSGWNVGRQTAQGLYDLCTPVSRANARPGDLVFFTGTYDSTNPVTHVGIYVGDAMMLHCGNPISYASIGTSYWQSHLYAFGRLP